MDITKIQIPDRLLDRPRDPRGYPITYITAMTQNGPDFATTDEAKRFDALKNNLCALCGKSLDDYQFYFIGGEKSYQSHAFIDPAMHGLCARYAIQVCPFLRGDISKYREKTLAMSDPNITNLRHADMDNVRPNRMGLFRSRSYQIVKGNGTLLIVAGKWNSEEWF
jgi:hypothetical protein